MAAPLTDVAAGADGRARWWRVVSRAGRAVGARPGRCAPPRSTSSTRKVQPSSDRARTPTGRDAATAARRPRPGGDRQPGPGDRQRSAPDRALTATAEVLGDRRGDATALGTDVAGRAPDLPADSEVHAGRARRRRRLPGDRRPAAPTGHGVVVTGLPTDEVDDAGRSPDPDRLLLACWRCWPRPASAPSLVRRQLRPLREVAATAHAVADAPARSGRGRPWPSACPSTTPTSAPRSARSARPQRDARATSRRPERTARERAAGAPVRRRRLPRAADAAGLHPRLRRAGPQPARRRGPRPTPRWPGSSPSPCG